MSVLDRRGGGWRETGGSGGRGRRADGGSRQEAARRPPEAARRPPEAARRPPEAARGRRGQKSKKFRGSKTGPKVMVFSNGNCSGRAPGDQGPFWGGPRRGPRRGLRHLLHLLPPQKRTVSNENIIIDVEVEKKQTVSNGRTCCCTCC